jgi:hypothetical protein
MRPPENQRTIPQPDDRQCAKRSPSTANPIDEAAQVGEFAQLDRPVAAVTCRANHTFPLVYREGNFVH